MSLNKTAEELGIYFPTLLRLANEGLADVNAEIVYVDKIQKTDLFKLQKKIGKKAFREVSLAVFGYVPGDLVPSDVVAGSFSWASAVFRRDIRKLFQTPKFKDAIRKGLDQRAIELVFMEEWNLAITKLVMES